MTERGTKTPTTLSLTPGGKALVPFDLDARRNNRWKGGPAKMIFFLVKLFQGQQTKRTSSSVSNADNEQEKTSKNSISNHFVHRLSSPSVKTQNSDQFCANNNGSNNSNNNNSKNAKNVFKPVSVSPTPPERPPKRPHLRSSPPPATRSPSPPPLLPRAHSKPPPPQPPPPLSSDENALEDAELRRIEDSARELRRLNDVGTTLAETLRNLPPPSRSPSPELPLPPPPPPPRPDDVEATVSDEPLPPPPTLTEVHQMATSPPPIYHKNSYMSYINGRHHGRHGFDGNYSKNSLVSNNNNNSVKANTQEKQNMESVATSLTPNAWERWHNIGRTGGTVVFTSQDIKHSGALKSLSNGSSRIRNSSSSSLSATNGKESSVSELNSSDSKQIKLGSDESVQKFTEPASYAPAYKPFSSFSQPRDTIAQKFLTVDRNKDEMFSTYTAKPLQRRSIRNGWWASLESLAPPHQSKSANIPNAASWPPNRRVSVDHSGLSDQHVVKLSDCETQTSAIETSTTPSRITSDSSSVLTCEERQSIAKSLFKDHRKNSSTQTALEQLSHVEVMTQTTPSIVKNGRFKRKEEIECEQLTKDLASQLPEEDRALQAILFPTSQLKTTADYLEGLFEMDSTRSTPAKKRTSSIGVGDKQEGSSSDEIKRSPEAAPLPADSAYFTTSESKAKFLTRYSKDVNKPLVLDAKDTAELGKKKEELINSISRKLEILRSEHLAIQEEIQGNQDLGKAVTIRVESSAKPNELDKYKQHIEETEKITSLLLSLSGRLARAENALMSPCENVNQEERKTLEAKRDKLFDQHEEAKKLKENIDRRSQRVSEFLSKYLTPEEYADYDHFIKMKSKLLIDSREIDEKIKLGEEQMLSLKDSLAKKPYQ